MPPEEIPCEAHSAPAGLGFGGHGYKETGTRGILQGHDSRKTEQPDRFLEGEKSVARC